MPSFEYLALNATGEKRRGFIEADSERQARQQLRDQSLVPVQLGAATNRHPLWRRRISVRDLSLFTRQLSALVQSGVPLDEALFACARQTGVQRMKSIILNLRSRVLEGRSLSDAIAEQDGTFPVIFPALVAAGEQSGHLDRVLVQLAEHCEKRQRLQSQILQACVYPVVLCIVAISVVMLLMTYVVPKVVDQFRHVGQELPWLTQGLITLSDFLRDYGVHGLLGGLMIGMLLRGLLRHAPFRYGLHRRMLSWPLLQGILLRQSASRLFGTLSLSLQAGVPLLEALSVAQATQSNKYIQHQVADVIEQVKEGRSLAAALEEVGVFPVIVIFMLANGEQSGELAKALKQVADQQEEELNSHIAIATSLLEPLMIILFGVLVLGIVLAILLPILQMNNFTQF